MIPRLQFPVVFLPLGLGLALISSPTTNANAAEKSSTSPPNVVLILADDLGQMGIGSYGSTFYETPHIDALAAGGMRFVNAFSAAANCAPSRASIMSGQYTPRHRVLYVGPGDYQDRWKKQKGSLEVFPMIQPHGETELPLATRTLAKSMSAAGYRTAMFGKWHLGTNENHPAKRGFDVAIESHGAHFNFSTDPETDHGEHEYLSDFLADRAVNFIEESAAGEAPFFLYYADFLVHKPFEAKEEYLDHFGKKEPSATQKSPMAGAMIKALDDSVGKIAATIERLGLAEDTIVIFTSDNGGLSYEEDGLREENTSNLPLRGRKGSEFDGGLRVPWIVQWPGHVPAGTVSETPVHHVDLSPTLLSLAGAEPPPQVLDGIDLLPVFRDPVAAGPDRLLFWYLPGYSAFHHPSVMVRKGDWKLIRSLDSEDRQLYDTRDDIGESKDLATSRPELASSLDRAAAAWLDETDAPRMKPNPEYRADSKGAR